MKKITSVFLLICMLLGLCSCGDKTSELSKTNSERMQVYTSFYAVYDLARQIGGDKADVYSMCPVGTEPHDYEPKTTDMARLSEADIFIYNGGGMESWAKKTADTLKGVTVVCTSDSVEAAEDSDPHIWLDPMNAVRQAETIKNAFAERDPANSMSYEANYNTFKDNAELLDAEYKRMVQSAVHRDIVVAHEAYGYLCKAYGLNQIAIENSQGGEPSPTRMSEIINYMRDNGIGYICGEELESTKTVEAIAAETGAEIVMLNPFEGDENGKDYFEVMRENLEVLSRILKG